MSNGLINCDDCGCWHTKKHHDSETFKRVQAIKNHTFSHTKKSLYIERLKLKAAAAKWKCITYFLALALIASLYIQLRA